MPRQARYEENKRVSQTSQLRPQFSHDSRKVFYSNVGAPLAKEILLDSKHKVSPLLEKVIAKSKAIQRDCKWQYCQRRAQDLIDAIAPV